MTFVSVRWVATAIPPWIRPDPQVASKFRWTVAGVVWTFEVGLGGPRAPCRSSSVAPVAEHASSPAV